MPCTGARRECSVKSRLLLLPAIGTAIAITLGGCSAAPPPVLEEPPVVEPTQDAPVTTPTPDPVDPRVEAAKADLQQFEGMSSAEIAALPDAEQARFVALTNIVNFPAYEKGWRAVASTQDQSVTNITKDSDPQTIMDFVVWEQRLTFSFTDDEREKYIQAMLYSGTDSYMYGVLGQFSKDNPNGLTGYATAQNGSMPLVTVTGSQDLVDKGDGTATRVITFSGVNGNRTATLHYNEASLSDGTVVPVWRVD